MACNNALLVRYVLEMSRGGCTDWGDPDPMVQSLASNPYIGNVTPGLPLSTITKVTGIGLGEEGEVEVPEWDFTTSVSDGKRKIQALGLQLRVTNQLSGAAGVTEFDTFANWFSVRSKVRMNFVLNITDRAWKVLYRYKFKDVEFRSWTQEDQELGAAKLGLIDMTFSPYSVELWSCSPDSVIVDTPSASASYTGACY